MSIKIFSLLFLIFFRQCSPNAQKHDLKQDLKSENFLTRVNLFSTWVKNELNVVDSLLIDYLVINNRTSDFRKFNILVIGDSLDRDIVHNTCFFAKGNIIEFEPNYQLFENKSMCAFDYRHGKYFFCDSSAVSIGNIFHTGLLDMSGCLMTAVSEGVSKYNLNFGFQPDLIILKCFYWDLQTISRKLSQGGNVDTLIGEYYSHMLHAATALRKMFPATLVA